MPRKDWASWFGTAACRILKFLHERTTPPDDPRRIGEALRGLEIPGR
jgi:hypothetical protein